MGIGGADSTQCTLLYSMDKNAEIARRYREKHGWDVPTHRLAAVMFKENPQFISKEAARDSLRYIEGKRGDKVRHKGMKPEIKRELNPYKLPEFEDRKREPFVLPLGCNNILALPDLHCPYTHTPSLNKAIAYGLDNNINCILLMGDVLDNHQISNYCSDPTRRSQEEEFAICKAMLVRIRELFPKATIYWLKGNHDIRWERYLLTRAKDIAMMNAFRIEEVLKLHEQNIIVIDDKTYAKAGNLCFHHGHHFFGRFAPVHAAKTLWDKTNMELMIGHCHTHTTYEKVTPLGIKRTFILGCLSEIGLNVDYNPITNQYRRGFAHVLINKDGTYHVNMIRGVED